MISGYFCQKRRILLTPAPDVLIFFFSFVHKFRLREKPSDKANGSEMKTYECLCIGNQNLGTVRVFVLFVHASIVSCLS